MKRLRMWISAVAVAAMTMAGYAGARQSGAAEGKEQPYVVEYYYKAKWGHAEEFLALFKKNHYPVLKKEMEMGRILKVSVAAPRLHGTEDGRWDYRVTIVFKSAAVANDNFDSEALTRQIYPDQESYKKEEQRRFEVLEGHWDLPVKEVAAEGK
jgi:TRAP-type mannitol/chloroaromatic compound transport system substrate-binding protein